MKVLKPWRRGKNIQLADRSEFGWATVRYYEADPLASNSDNEKRIKKAEKEAQKEVEKKVAKWRRGTSNTAAKHRRAGWSDQPGPSSRRDTVPPLLLGQAQSAGTLPSVWGFRSSCSKLHSEGQAVSFSQPVVSNAEVNVELSGSHKGVDRVTVVSAACQRANKYFGSLAYNAKVYSAMLQQYCIGYSA